MTKTNEVVIPAEEFQRMVGRHLRRHLLMNGMDHGPVQTLVLAVEVPIAACVTVRRLIDGSYVFTQQVSDQVTPNAKSVMGEFDAQREKALKAGAD